jgi:hypothetical protein
MNRAISEQGVLDQAEGDAGMAEPDMRAARECNATAVRDDLHQRFPCHGQLLDTQSVRWGVEMTPKVILCKMARRQVSHHEVPIPQVTPSNRLLIR